MVKEKEGGGRTYDEFYVLNERIFIDISLGWEISKKMGLPQNKDSKSIITDT